MRQKQQKFLEKQEEEKPEKKGGNKEYYKKEEEWSLSAQHHFSRILKNSFAWQLSPIKDRKQMHGESQG